MHTIFIIGFCATATYYLYMVIFDVRNTLIDKLTNLAIYNDAGFRNRKKYIKEDWDLLKYRGFLRKRPIIFAMFAKEGILLLIMPFIAGLFGIMAFGHVPGHSLKDADLNAEVGLIIAGSYYFFAIAGCIFHAIYYKKYKDKAMMEKLRLEGRSIISE